jgi:hypothetical protein
MRLTRSTDRRGEVEEDARPRSYSDRQETLSRRFIRRQRFLQEKFRRRAQTFSLRKEAARNLFITGCLGFDVLVVPEPALIFGGAIGLALSGILLAASLALEIDFYRTHFSLPRVDEEA